MLSISSSDAKKNGNDPKHNDNEGGTKDVPEVTHV
jgi:hypothetical protein